MPTTVQDFKDFYIRYKGHPRYNSTKIIADDLVEVIVQKLEMILFTNKGEVLGDPDMGCDLEYYLWETNLSNRNLEQKIIEQIDLYIPELSLLNYEFNLQIVEGDVTDMLYLNFLIRGFNVTYIISE
jgi:phage baseplate assembly protein W